jgi:rod shape-determining protein MreC
MHKRAQIFPLFFLCLILSGIILLFSNTFFGQLVRGFFEQVTVPVQRTVFSLLHNAPQEESQTFVEKQDLQSLQLKLKELEKENGALRDQFETVSPNPRSLIPVQVIGMHDDAIVIDKGSNDGIKTGMIVVVKDNLVGRISQSSSHLAIVNLVSDRTISFTAETVKTEALGVSRGKGGYQIFLENVVLSDKLEKNDLVKTKGDIAKDGTGYPPGLIVGKIASVDKRASALFQTAEVRSLLDLSRLSMVFVMKGNN